MDVTSVASAFVALAVVVAGARHVVNAARPPRRRQPRHRHRMKARRGLPRFARRIAVPPGSATARATSSSVSASSVAAESLLAAIPKAAAPAHRLRNSAKLAVAIVAASVLAALGLLVVARAVAALFGAT